MPRNQANRDSLQVTGLQVGGVTGLTVALDGDGPTHQRLVRALRAQVTDGRLRPGDRLPASRVLADELGVSRWVVTEAYDQLKAEGYLQGRVGSGTVVGNLGDRQGPDGHGARDDGTSATTATTGGTPTATTGADGSGPPALDVSPALPDLASFPRTAWRAALVAALAEISDHELGHPHLRGAPHLRGILADYLRRVRGLTPDPEQVQITQGVRHAVALVCRVLHERGATRLAIENPSWPRLRELAEAAGLDVVPVPVDPLGMRVDLLEASGADAVFTTPTHQFPTGVPLDADRRLALARWAAHRPGRVIVEDDYDAEFRYDRRPIGALAALAPDHVIYLGSVSKTLGPGLHLGWMIAPSPLHPALDQARRAIGALPPTLDQHALAHLIATGTYDRHLRRMRRVYRHRRERLLAALASADVPGAPAEAMDAGLHVLWLLPPGADEGAVLTACARRGIHPLGLDHCRVTPGTGRTAHGAGLVIGYGNVPDHRVGEVASRVAGGVREGLGSGLAPQARALSMSGFKRPNRMSVRAE